MGRSDEGEMVLVEEAMPVTKRPYEVEDGLVRLHAGRCPGCGAVFCPAGLVCAGCGHRGLDEILLSPRGTIYTFTQVHQSTPEFGTPYSLVYVDFPEEVRVMLPVLEGEIPRIGEAVQIVLAPGPRLVDGDPEEGPHAKMATERSESNG